MNYKNLTKETKEQKKKMLLKLVSHDWMSTNEIAEKSKEKNVFDNYRSVALNLNKLHDEGKIVMMKAGKYSMWKKEVVFE